METMMDEQPPTRALKVTGLTPEMPAAYDPNRDSFIIRCTLSRTLSTFELRLLERSPDGLTFAGVYGACIQVRVHRVEDFDLPYLVAYLATVEAKAAVNERAAQAAYAHTLEALSGLIEHHGTLSS